MKKMATFSLIALGLVLIGSSPIQADQGPRGQGRFNFEQLDKNGDGKISRDEFPGRPEFFDRLDGNGDGFITRDEMGQMRQWRGQRPALGENLLQALDTDGDGKITRDEFARIADFFGQLDRDADGSLNSEELAGLARVRPEPGGVNVEALFEQYDVDRDGKLSAAEMSASPQFKNPRFFTMLDKDQDGFITREELKSFLNTYQAKRPSS